jgi:hypothetical protein
MFGTFGGTLGTYLSKRSTTALSPGSSCPKNEFTSSYDFMVIKELLKRDLWVKLWKHVY